MVQLGRSFIHLHIISKSVYNMCEINFFLTKSGITKRTAKELYQLNLFTPSTFFVYTIYEHAWPLLHHLQWDYLNQNKLLTTSKTFSHITTDKTTKNTKQKKSKKKRLFWIKIQYTKNHGMIQNFCVQIWNLHEICFVLCSHTCLD
jgi:hypothetical protein